MPSVVQCTVELAGAVDAIRETARKAVAGTFRTRELTLRILSIFGWARIMLLKVCPDAVPPILHP
jgi:hypothetical protein